MRNILLIPLVFLTACAGAQEIRPAALAGSWYNGDSAGLSRDVDGFLSKGPVVRHKEAPVALLAPHAGYRYSGAVAGQAYSLLQGHSFNRVIILAPAHRYPLKGASIAPVTHYRTPLGNVALDRDVCDVLLKKPNFQSVPAAHGAEHSIEIHLPFLQRTLKDFKIVPVLIGNITRETAGAIAEEISRHVDGKTLVIASSDFTHYGKRFGFEPFGDDPAGKIRELDMGAVNLILKGDCDGFYRYRLETGATICGWLPICVMLDILKGKVSAELIQYDTSGNMEKNYTNSVSYVAMSFFRPSKEPGKIDAAELESEDFLNEDEQNVLLEMSREVLNTFVRTGRVPAVDLKRAGVTEQMKAKRGVFVTLKKGDRLRGCIGYIKGFKPVYEGVADNTISACSRDSRFPPVRAEELEDITISLSVMSELIPVKDAGTIRVGRDGLVIQKGARSGILLPQVPLELGWDRDRFLVGICRKAGLPVDAWKDGASMWRFSAQVFGEDKKR